MLLLIAILIIVLVYLIIVIICDNKRKHCLTSCCKKEGLTSRGKKGCPIMKAVFKPAIKYLGKIDQKSFSNDTNARSLKNVCKMGNDVLNDCSKYNIFNDPMKDKEFLTLCCNNNHELCSSGIGSDCIINKAKLATSSYNYTNFNDSSADVNADALRNYCILGKQVLDNGCVVDELHPEKDPIYKKYCCNSSSDMSVCGPEIVDKCVIGKSRFMNQSYNLQNWTDQTAASNIGILKDFCTIGKNLTDGGCVGGLNPMNDIQYKKYCCTSGYDNDPTQCGPEMINKCISGKAQFSSQSSNFPNWTEGTILSNVGTVKAFCDLGQELIDKSCTGLNPMTDTYYKKYCCNSSNDVSQCGSYNVDDCIVNRAKFNELNNSISSMSQSSIGSNMDTVLKFCELADTLKLKTCAGSDPTSVKNYALYCM